jgi:cytochrome c oxidase subunit 2
VDSLTARMSILDPSGPQARSIDGIWNVFLAVSIAVCVAVVVVHIVAMVRAHRRRQDAGDPARPDPAQARRLARVIIAAAAVTTMALFVLVIESLMTGNALAALDDDPDPLVIKVTAHQWWWQLDYAPDSPDGGAPTANEMHIPVGRTVRVLLTSADVIHSFWVPSLHGKRDAIPARTNTLVLRADQAGVYRGPCAEFCGLQHAQMTLTVVAEPPADFERWLASQRAEAVAQLPEPALHGREVFMSTTCAICHTIRGSHAGGRIGPDLTHLASRAELAAGAIPNTRGHLGGWVLDPQAIKPGTQMSPTRLAGDDLRALLAYLEMLR